MKMVINNSTNGQLNEIFEFFDTGTLDECKIFTVALELLSCFKYHFKQQEGGKESFITVGDKVLLTKLSVWEGSS